MHTEKHTHWHILGAGAIGTLVAFKLSEQRRVFTLMGRVTHNDSRHFTDLDNVQQHLIGVERDAIDYLVICTKSTQALDAFTSIESRLNPQSIVICLFNGLGAQQVIQERANCPVFFATTTEGVSKIAPGHYAYKGAGETVVDNLILEHIAEDELPSLFKVVDNIEERLMNKLVVNSLINPLTVLFDCLNGQLLSNAKAMALMQVLADEIALWLSTYLRDTSAGELLKLTAAVAKATANNSSSMRQDIASRMVSEIDFINGYWLSHNPKGLDLKENARLVTEIKKIETGLS